MKNDILPKWMLYSMTDEELLNLYHDLNLTFVKMTYTFEEFKTQWKNEMVNLKTNNC